MRVLKVRNYYSDANLPEIEDWYKGRAADETHWSDRNWEMMVAINNAYERCQLKTLLLIQRLHKKAVCAFSHEHKALIA